MTVRNIFAEDIKNLECLRVEKEQETFDNLVPVEDVEGMNWDDLDL